MVKLNGVIELLWVRFVCDALEIIFRKKFFKIIFTCLSITSTVIISARIHITEIQRNFWRQEQFTPGGNVSHHLIPELKWKKKLRLTIIWQTRLRLIVCQESQTYMSRLKYVLQIVVSTLILQTPDLLHPVWRIICCIEPSSNAWIEVHDDLKR